MTVFTAAGWWGEFWANLAADLVVALVVGIVLARYLGIRSERARRRELREKSLELISNELRANRKELARLEKQWSEGKPTMSYLETEAWRLASENQLLQGLDANFARLLLKAYVKLIHLERRSRMLWDLLLAFRNHIGETTAQKELLEPLVKATRSCAEELDQAIQAFDSHFAK